MGSLILCHANRARQPYEITRVHVKIYTIEELCYYIYHHLYLVDYTLADHQLCEWISEELKLDNLAEKLKNLLNNNGSTDEFIITLLEEASMYSDSEIEYAKEKLLVFNELSPAEKDKFKADQLLKDGEYESAVLIYLRIIKQPWDETLDTSFYGEVYACLGAIYGKMFLYENSAAMYEEACKYLEDENVLKAYIYSCFRAYPEEIYEHILSVNPVYSEIDEVLKRMIAEAKNRASESESDVKIAIWKNNYRGLQKI